MHRIILNIVLATLAASSTMSMSSRSILITGGSAGIGLALCRQLAVDHVDKCDKVYMGVRSHERGNAGLQFILNVHPNVAHRIELLIIDVTNDNSVNAAAKQLQSKGVSLYALVNNAGVGLNTDNGSMDTLLQTNFYGPKRVTDAFIPLLHPHDGRIVNVSSGAASMWLRNESPTQQQLFTKPTTTWDELEHAVQLSCSTASRSGYGISKAGLTAYTIQCAALYPNLLITSLSPGFIETKMTMGYGAKLSPEQGTVSLMKCLFGKDVTSGYYYGSDGLRSPLTETRDPGTPEYMGE
jgi:NAD(P)-dependent dehydrogenase (short-subunit alcohol dehydrogenase family)